MIRGTTALVAHIGWPTHAFKAPMIYNPYFERAGIDAVVVPMGCRAEHYPAFLRAVFTLENIRGALITMPHKVSTVACSTSDRPRCRSPAPATRCGAMPTAACRRPVRRRRLRPRPAPQGLRARRRPRAGRRRRRRRLGDRCVARGGRRGARSASSTRAPTSAEALAARLRAHYPALAVADWVERSGGLRHRRQRDAARHEGRRPDADRRGAHCAERLSSARW